MSQNERNGGDDKNNGGDVKDIPDIPEAVDAESGSNGTAEKEQKAIFSGQYDEYDQDGKRQNHRRTQGLRNVVFQAIRVLVVFGVFAVLALAFVWLWHVITPWKWLCPDEIDRVQTLLFSGALSTAITLLARQLK